MKQREKEIHSAVEKIKKLGGEKIRFIILYGSISKNKQNTLSDIDLAVYYEGSKEERFKFRMNILGRVSDEFDIQIFQDLPIYVKKEVIRGKVLYVANSKFLYDIDRKTYQYYDDFKNRFFDYIRGGVIS